ncbi:universal stress protein [Maribacter sp. 2307ULW6-5]|uniref:universal stress protein n=1 Tax=Maribacter sp. 2307ULW6-5 TaxID=3386275 RepID=UPI0039BC97DD
MNRILVPVDFSEHSANALEVAAQLAKKTNAEIMVVHMLGISDAVLTKDESQSFMEAKFYMKLAKKRFAEFLDKPYLKDLKITETVQNYTVFTEIGQIAKENGAELIVMGSHGTSGLSEIFVGSNTEKVVRSAEVPVLVIKKQRSDFKMEKVVFAFDFRVESTEAYHRAVNFFSQMKAQLHLVHVNLPGVQFMNTTEIQKDIDGFIRVAHHGELPAHIHVAMVSDYSVEDGVYNYAKKVDADAITITTHGRSGLAHFFKGSIGEDIANHVDLPVMTFKI